MDISLCNDDITITNGDFVTSAPIEQRIHLLLATAPGEWKQHPTRGVGINSSIEHHDTGQLARRIQTELTQDGLRVDAVNFNNNHINITAYDIIYNA